MADIRLYIGDKEADLYPQSVDLSISYSIAEIRDINARKSSITKTLTIPATGNNKKLFGFVEDISSDEGLDQTTREPARIEVDGTRIIEGFLKTTEAVINKAGSVTDYKVIIIGDNGDWLNRIKELNVNEIDLSEYDHIYNKTNIDDSEFTTGTNKLREKAIIYPLIDYGVFALTTRVSVIDRFPAIQVKHLFLKMFNEQGYKVASEFVDSDFFDRLYIPYTGKLQLVTPEELLRRSFRAQLTNSQQQFAFSQHFNNQSQTQTFTLDALFDNDLTNGNFDNGTAPNQFDAAAKTYKPDRSGRYTLVFECSYRLRIESAWTQQINHIDHQAGTQRIGLNFEIYNTATGTVLGAKEFVYSGITNFGDTVLPDKIFMGNNVIGIESNGTETAIASNVFLSAGDEIKCRLRVVSLIDYRPAPGVTGQDFVEVQMKAANTKFYNRPLSGRLSEGSEIFMNNFLPDIKQTDLVKALKHMFNLYFYTDVDSRTVYIEPRDDFYNTSIVDWTDKLDHSKPITVQFLGDNLTRNIEYSYKLDEKDAMVVRYNEEIPDDLATHTVTVANKFAKDGLTTNGNEVFAATLMGIHDLIGFRNTRLPRMWAEVPPASAYPPAQYEYENRILYYNGRNNLPAEETWFFANKTPRTTWPEFYSVDEVNDNDNSLYFNDTYRSNGLFQKYYRNLHKTIDESRRFTAFINLNDADISTLDFRKAVQLTIDGETNLYRLNRVQNYNPSTPDTTVCELFKIVADVPRAGVTTVAENGAILPPTEPSEPDPDPVGIVATLGGVTTSVLVPAPGGGVVALFKAAVPQQTTEIG